MYWCHVDKSVLNFYSEVMYFSVVCVDVDFLIWVNPKKDAVFSPNIHLNSFCPPVTRKLSVTICDPSIRYWPKCTFLCFPNFLLQIPCHVFSLFPKQFYILLAVCVCIKNYIVNPNDVLHKHTVDLRENIDICLIRVSAAVNSCDLFLYSGFIYWNLTSRNINIFTFWIKKMLLKLDLIQGIIWYMLCRRSIVPSLLIMIIQ